MKVTNELTSKLEANEIFVFGSNLGGYHGGGAARVAFENFDAVMGVGVGFTGQCYALPTKSKELETLPLADINKSVNELYIQIQNHPDTFFVITAVGCGIAGYTADDIAPMFKDFLDFENISLPQSFIDVLIP